VSIVDGWIPCPSTVVAAICDISLYKARKEIKKLKEEGLVVSNRYIDNDEDNERPIIVNGYTITNKAKETAEYKLAFEEERAACMEIFGFDIGGGNTDELLQD
jgi:hypothetical protein